MADNLDKIKQYLFDLGLDISEENEAEQLVIISDEVKGFSNLMIDCEDSIVILEQFIFELKKINSEILKKLLQWNREVIHGAFVLDDSGTKVLFRDTLQVKNLDINELEASINSLSLALAEYGEEIIKFAKI